MINFFQLNCNPASTHSLSDMVSSEILGLQHFKERLWWLSLCLCASYLFFHLMFYVLSQIYQTYFVSSVVLNKREIYFPKIINIYFFQSQRQCRKNTQSKVRVKFLGFFLMKAVWCITFLSLSDVGAEIDWKHFALCLLREASVYIIRIK